MHTCYGDQDAEDDWTRSEIQVQLTAFEHDVADCHYARYEQNSNADGKHDL